MITNAYENTYVSVGNAKQDTADLSAVCEFLRAANRPVTCKEIGIAIFGKSYTEGYMTRHYINHLSQMLRHLVRGGFVRWDKIDGEPVEIEDQEYIREDSNGNTAEIRVWDKDGNEYMMPNPKYNPYRGGAGRWVKVKKTIVPKIKVYTWVA